MLCIHDYNLQDGPFDKAGTRLGDAPTIVGLHRPDVESCQWVA